ncbi:MAG: hypothetical protein V4541_05490 [Bacteroidota bacterium]
MKVIENMTALNKIELLQINGGITPSKNTSFANDLSYYTVYGARALWDGLKAFSAGAARGQEVRFSG